MKKIKNVEIIHDKELFNSYLNGKLNTLPFLNLYHKYDLKKIVKNVIGSKSKNAIALFTFLFCTEVKKDELDLVFSNGTGTTKLGEGRAKIYFIKFKNIIVVYFNDSRGTSIEIEKAIENFDSKELNIFLTDLLKMHYENFESVKSIVDRFNK